MMKYGCIWILTAAVLFGMCPSGAAFPPPMYSAKEIRATVVDEATGKPLEGVAIVAQWVLERPGSDKPRLHIFETVTGPDGQFTIPAWGPKPRLPFTVLGNLAPQLLLFKTRYTPLALRSVSPEWFAKALPGYRNMATRDIARYLSGTEGQPDAPIQDSVWNGLTIQLTPFQGTPDRWLELLEHQLRMIRDEDARHVRAFLRAIAGERAHFASHPVPDTHRASVLELFDRIDRLSK